MAVESSVRKVKLEVGSGGRETGRGLEGRGGPHGPARQGPVVQEPCGCLQVVQTHCSSQDSVPGGESR